MGDLRFYKPTSTPGIAQRTRVTLTSAQILALHGTPITLVAAPPAGKVISVDEIVGKLTFKSTQYTGANAVEFRYTDGSGAKVTGDAASAWLDGSVTAYVKTIAAAVTPINAAVVAAVPSANPAAGDSTVTFDVLYRIVTL
ncbi:MAG TPA: hypothetical protein VH234_06215 [Candidatus Saccharimonadales bacterium]|jgi:hypothetical protein|nr:hypothetical protein [Candidatus Saccharimonadales bacterium]